MGPARIEPKGDKAKGILQDMRKIRGDGEWMWVIGRTLAIEMALDAKAGSVGG